VRLRDERGKAHVDGAPPAFAPGDRGDALRERPDGPHVLLRLAGEPHHEVELQRMPAAAEDPLRRLEDVVVADVLVHGAPQPFRPRLGGEREAGLAHPAELRDRVLPQGVEPQRREGEGDVLRLQGGHRLGDEPVDAAVVGGGERQEPHLVVPRLRRGLLQVGQHRERVSFAHRPVCVAGLAEAASAGAAARDLDAQAVVDHAHRREDRVGQQRRAGEVREHAARDARGDARDVHPFDPGEPREQGGAGPPGGLALLDGGDDLKRRLLAVPDEEGVEEGGDRRGVQRADAARDDQRVPLAPVLRQQGDPRKIQHQEDVGVGELVAEREPHHVEVAGGAPRLERGERLPRGPQVLRVVGPRGEDALAQRPGPRVQDPVEQEDPEVGHPDLIGVRKGKQDARPGLLPGKKGGTHLAAAVPGRLPDGWRDLRHRHRYIPLY